MVNVKVSRKEWLPCWVFQTVKDYVREMVRLVSSRHRRCDRSDTLLMSPFNAVPEEVSNIPLP